MDRINANKQKSKNFGSHLILLLRTNEKQKQKNLSDSTSKNETNLKFINNSVWKHNL